ncbi:hypothetical protein BDV93DRAFT_529347 [Ceratobasidium sp. AG-I]|nr:hypothetical protein BDV93DRAFT_529347 [Ceratobasidium sp. AG-I]
MSNEGACDICFARSANSRCDHKTPCNWCGKRQLACTYERVQAIALAAAEADANTPPPLESDQEDDGDPPAPEVEPGVAKPLRAEKDKRGRKEARPKVSRKDGKRKSREHRSRRDHSSSRHRNRNTSHHRKSEPKRKRKRDDSTEEESEAGSEQESDDDTNDHASDSDGLAGSHIPSDTPTPPRKGDSKSKKKNRSIIAAELEIELLREQLKTERAANARMQGKKQRSEPSRRSYSGLTAAQLLRPSSNLYSA